MKKGRTPTSALSNFAGQTAVKLTGRSRLIAQALDDRAFLLVRVRRAVDRVLRTGRCERLLAGRLLHGLLAERLLTGRLRELLFLDARLVAEALDDRAFLL